MVQGLCVGVKMKKVKKLHKQAHEDLKKDFVFDKPKEKKPVRKYGAGGFGKSI
jgi:hypothetical protein